MLQERFSTALHNTARAWRQAVDRRLKFLGVSQASWMTIAVAAKAESPLSQSELADRLVKAGLVLRVASTTDRRVKRVVLTEAGNRLYDKVRAEAAAFRHELLANVDPGQLSAATELLEKLHDILQAGT